MMMDHYQCEAADLLADGLSPEDTAGDAQNETAQEVYRYEVIEMRSSFTAHAPYGILGRQEHDGSWVPVAVAAPFSADLEAVRQLAETCTTLQISPGQLIYVVSDALAQAIIDSKRCEAPGKSGDP